MILIYSLLILYLHHSFQCWLKYTIFDRDPLTVYQNKTYTDLYLSPCSIKIFSRLKGCTFFTLVDCSILSLLSYLLLKRHARESCKWMSIKELRKISSLSLTIRKSCNKSSGQFLETPNLIFLESFLMKLRQYYKVTVSIIF